MCEIDKKCKFCGNIIPHRDGEQIYDYKRKIFCNRHCSTEYNNMKRSEIKYHKCLNCDKETKNPKFCSTKCASEFRKNARIQDWLDGKLSGNTDSDWGGLPDYIRAYLFKKYDNKCAICGWGEVNPYTGTIPLEVEHIDGNAENNRPENLTLLCPNCHSLTSTYRGANKGHGRKITWIPKNK